MMTYNCGLLISVALAVVVDGSPIVSSIDQPTPFKYTFRVEKLEFGGDLEGCGECEGDSGIVIGNNEKPDDSFIPDHPNGDQGAEFCEFLKKFCNNEDYVDEAFKRYPENQKLYLLICENYEYICGDNEPDYPDIDQGARVCMELEKACGDGDYPDEIKDNPEMKRMFSLMCENIEYICSKDDKEPEEPGDFLTPDGDEFCLFLKMACDNEDYVDEEFKKYPETKKIYLLACSNYDHICGENNPDDYYIPDYLDIDQGKQVCIELERACGNGDYPDDIKDNPEAKRMFALMCENYEYVCGENDDNVTEEPDDYPDVSEEPDDYAGLPEDPDDYENDDDDDDEDDGESSDEDMNNETYEEIYQEDEDDYYEDEDSYYENEDDVEEGGNEQEEYDEYNEIKRYERADGVPRTLKRRNALAHKVVAPKLKRQHIKQHLLLTKRDRAP